MIFDIYRKFYLFASRRMIVWGLHSWWTNFQEKCFFLENIFPCANILHTGVLNEMTRMILIYFNFIFMQLSLIFYDCFLYNLGPKNYFNERSIKLWNRKTTVRLKLWLKIVQRLWNTAIVFWTQKHFTWLFWFSSNRSAEIFSLNFQVFKGLTVLNYYNVT